MMKYLFTIPLTPRIKKNSRPIYRNKKTGKPFLGKDKGLSEYEENGTLILQIQKNKLGIKAPLTGELRAFFQFDFKGKSVADFDNLINCASDLLQKSGIILNDKQITSGGFLVRRETGITDQTLIQLQVIRGAETASTEKGSS